VHLINEQQGSFAGLQPVSGAGEHFSQIGDAVKHCGYGLKGHPSFIGQQSCDGCLTGAWRPPEDDRGKLALVQHAPQAPVWPDQLVLTNNITKALRAQQLGKRRPLWHLVLWFEIKLAHGVILTRNRLPRQKKSGWQQISSCPKHHNARHGTGTHAGGFSAPLAVSAHLWRDIGMLGRKCPHRCAIMAGVHTLS
jgi:hypothetical protein